MKKICLNHYYNKLKKTSHSNTLVKDSIAYNYEEKGNKQALVVKREHLMEKEYWKDWAFSIVILLKNRIKLSKKGKEFTLHIDLKNEDIGIYNNKGKEFLSSKFNTPLKLKEFFDSNIKVESFLNSKKENDELPLDLAPLRWASGGVLPIVEWKNQTWFCLFFRDIHPIGWNIANGASENKEEYKDLSKLIYREFSEELILLNKEPSNGETLKHIRFYHKDFTNSEKYSPFSNEEYFSEYHKKRHNEDGFNLDFTANDDNRNIEVIKTPFSLRVNYHQQDNLTTESSKTENIVFNINPYELGIEICKLLKFTLKSGEEILDGEILEKQGVLLRRPVLLLSINKLKKIYEQNQSLGTFDKSSFHKKEQRDCKYLKSLEKEDYHLFSYDLKFKNQIIRSHTQESFESRFIREWLTKYNADFQALLKNQDILKPNNIDILSLCPVTWKTIETIFKHNIKI